MSLNPNQWTTCWVTTSTIQDTSRGDDDGRVQVIDDTGTPVPDVDQLGLPGHYAKSGTGVSGYMLRLENGGKIVACYTQPPTDAVSGESGLTDGTAQARMLPTHKFEVPHTAVVGGISLGAIDGTDLGPAPPGPLPAPGVIGQLYPVGRSGDLVQLGSTPIGNVIASTTRTKAT